MKDNILLYGNGSKVVAYKPVETMVKVDLISFFNVDKRVFEDLRFANFEGHTSGIRVLRALNDGVMFLSGTSAVKVAF